MQFKSVCTSVFSPGKKKKTTFNGKNRKKIVDKI